MLRTQWSSEPALRANCERPVTFPKVSAAATRSTRIISAFVEVISLIISRVGGASH